MLKVAVDLGLPANYINAEILYLEIKQKVSKAHIPPAVAIIGG